ncbi:hypothetical protein [Changpingibacter yushuensis]|uniref:hypothetical protein n=1 Tax=Changpingibacter yushuensis TaxID=2758440 RepID=UPI0015F5DD20|nr:hypothetical protein [Changpingibacter yushuensis]
MAQESHVIAHLWEVHAGFRETCKEMTAQTLLISAEETPMSIGGLKARIGVFMSGFSV